MFALALSKEAVACSDAPRFNFAASFLALSTLLPRRILSAPKWRPEFPLWR